MKTNKLLSALILSALLLSLVLCPAVSARRLALEQLCFSVDIPDADEQPGGYIILTRDSSQSEIQELFDYSVSEWLESCEDYDLYIDAYGLDDEGYIERNLWISQIKLDYDHDPFSQLSRDELEDYIYEDDQQLYPTGATTFLLSRYADEEDESVFYTFYTCEQGYEIHFNFYFYGAPSDRDVAEMNRIIDSVAFGQTSQAPGGLESGEPDADSTDGPVGALKDIISGWSAGKAIKIAALALAGFALLLVLAVTVLVLVNRKNSVKMSAPSLPEEHGPGVPPTAYAPGGPGTPDPAPDDLRWIGHSDTK